MVLASLTVRTVGGGAICRTDFLTHTPTKAHWIQQTYAPTTHADPRVHAAPRGWTFSSGSAVFSGLRMFLDALAETV